MLWSDLAACIFPNICIYSFMRGYNTSARLWEQLRSSTICHSFVFIRDIWARASLPPMGCLVQVVMGAGIFLFLCCADLNFFVCVRDGSICGCIVTTTFVHKSRNLWQTRLCICRSHALTFLLHSNTSIIVVSSQVTQWNYLLQSDRFGAKELWQYKVTPLCSVAIGKSPEKFRFGFLMKINFSNNFHIDVQASATSRTIMRVNISEPTCATHVCFYFSGMCLALLWSDKGSPMAKAML